MVSDKAIMKEIMHLRNSSVENPLAYNQIPSQYQPTYQSLIQKHQSRRRAFPQVLHHQQHFQKYYHQPGPHQYQSQLEQQSPQQYDNPNSRQHQGLLNTTSEEDIFSSNGEQQFAKLEPDDRGQRYQDYLYNLRQPNKDQHLYLSTRDIDGAQPKSVYQQNKGKRKFNLIGSPIESIQEQHPQSHQQLLMNNKSNDINLSLNNQQQQQLQDSSTKFQHLSNFDKLYNKRIDWKPLVIHSSMPMSPLVKSGAQQLQARSPINESNRNYNEDQRGKLNETPVGQIMSLGQGVAGRRETTSNQYGKFITSAASKELYRYL